MLHLCLQEHQGPTRRGLQAVPSALRPIPRRRRQASAAASDLTTVRILYVHPCEAGFKHSPPPLEKLSAGLQGSLLRSASGASPLSRSVAALLRPEIIQGPELRRWALLGGSVGEGARRPPHRCPRANMGRGHRAALSNFTSAPEAGKCGKGRQEPEGSRHWGVGILPL